ncbi:MAG: Maf family protein [Desulfotignum sp.]|jgi:septum formation protein|nr:Maf family protein [Desulfotignum sp.]
MKWMDTDKLVLASRSPRRKELLEQMGLAVEIIPADVDETEKPGQQPLAVVKALSQKKTRHIMQLQKNAWVLGADTIVVKDGQTLGKPENREQAIHMLGLLSGRTHAVYTGYSVGHFVRSQMKTHAVATQVVFKTLTRQEILWYTGTQEPYDKAGGYAIQGLGAFLVKEIHGSYSNVVGLPVCELIQTLAALEVIQFKDSHHDMD